MNIGSVNIEDLDIVALISGGGLIHSDKIEESMYVDAMKFCDIKGMYPSLQDWVEGSNCSEFLNDLFCYAFVFGGCSVINGSGESYCYREKFFRQFIGDSKELREWIDETCCTGLLNELYDIAFKVGTGYMRYVMDETNLKLIRHE